MSISLPYRIAALCYLFDEQGRVLLLHRYKEPNIELYSPIGGKLEQQIGESPTACAIREIHEEVEITCLPEDLHLTGIISETGYLDATHWLIFLYELTCPAKITRFEFNEGVLEWHEPAKLMDLPIPQTDRQIIWPLFWRYRRKFFTAHINCQGGDLQWRLEQPCADVTDWSDHPVQ